MAYQVVMPRLGWAMEKGRLVEWLKKDGDAVKMGESLFTVESDKALQEVEALESGTLRLIPHSPPPGSEMPVGTPLAYLLQPGERMPASHPGEPSSSETPRRPEPMAVPGLGPSTVVVAPQPSKKLAISPRARRIAREMGVDWSAIRGSGRTGRIVERDIRRAAAVTPQAATLTPAVKPSPSHLAQGARDAARNLAAQPASVTLHTAADATDLVALAERFASTWPPDVLKAPASLCLLLKLVALALQEHPSLNASLQDGHILIHHAVHITLAMEQEGIFRWPVIHDVAALSVQGIAKEANRLHALVHSGALSPEDLRSGTFSVIDLGEYGVDTFTPLIVAPQCAVLGLGRIALAPSVYEGRITPRYRLSLSLTFDHRIVDGAPAARFLDTIREYVEQPYRWLFR